jgi:hypothetical protein
MIDCHPNMFDDCISTVDAEQNEDEISPMDAALRACEQLFRNKVMHVATTKTGKRDGIGVMLYGTKTVVKRVRNKSNHNRDDSDDEDEDSIENDNDSNNMDDVDDTHDETSCVQMLIDLNAPGIEQIKNIRKCLYDEIRGRQRDLKTELSPIEKGDTLDDAYPPIRSAVYECSKVFSNAS